MLNEELKKKNYYRQNTIQMVEQIENLEFLESIYWFVKVVFEKKDKKKEG